MSTCPGFAQKHGEQPREKRANTRWKALPSALEAAQPSQRIREYSNDGTFKEKIPEALLDALHWWKDETQAQDKTVSSLSASTTTTNTPTTPNTSTTSTTPATQPPWKQDDGTDRFYWHTLLKKNPTFVSIFAASNGEPPHLITLENRTQTAREQCGMDALCSFSTNPCNHCGLQAKFKKSRCTACKSVYYCSTRCQQEHWKLIHRTECKATAAAAREKEGCAK